MEIIEALQKDEKLRKKLSKLVASEIILDPEIRLAVIEKTLGDVVTKEYFDRELDRRLSEFEKRLKDYIDTRISDLNRRMDDLNTRIDDLYRVTLSSLVAIVVTLATVVITRIL